MQKNCFAKRPVLVKCETKEFQRSAELDCRFSLPSPSQPTPLPTLGEDLREAGPRERRESSLRKLGTESQVRHTRSRDIAMNRSVRSRSV